MIWRSIIAGVLIAAILSAPSAAQDVKEWNADEITQDQLDGLLVILDQLSATVAEQKAELEALRAGRPQPEPPTVPDGTYAGLTQPEINARLRNVARDRFRGIDGEPPRVFVPPQPLVPDPAPTPEAPTPGPVTEAPVEPAFALVRVARNETVYAIARLSCVNPIAVLDANPMADPDRLGVGDVLRVPVPHCLPPDRVFATLVE